jgi:zinc transport system ATP-binding protein
MDFLRARARLMRGAAAHIERILDAVDISREVSEGMIGTLSGGQFQRLLIGFALLGEPSVLMLDEPTAGIDEPGQRRLNELVRRLQEDGGLTVLFISHELSVIYQYADNVLCLGHGRDCFGPPRGTLTPDLLRETYGASVGIHPHG